MTVFAMWHALMSCPTPCETVPCNIETVSTIDLSQDGPDPSADLLQSSIQGRLLLHYQELMFTSETITLGWLYSGMPMNPCPVSDYQVNIYAQDEINAKIEGNLTILEERSSSGTAITIESLLLNISNSANYFRISALQQDNSPCAESAYYYNLLFSG